jgi:hypothetical protein
MDFSSAPDKINIQSRTTAAASPDQSLISWGFSADTKRRLAGASPLFINLAGIVF